MSHIFDNVAWHALTGPQARFAAGTGGARRYARGFSPIVAFEDNAHADFDALRPHCEPGELLYTVGWTGPVPAGWHMDVDATMFKMVWDAPMPEADDAPDALRLGPQHVPQALELTALTRPGPFGPRTMELGDYFGYVDGPSRLVAMTGERMQAGPFHEISGVCTHPDAQGQGYARKLMRKVIRLQMLRGETPFLHVMAGNANAVRLYERMGFRTWHELAVRVVQPRSGLRPPPPRGGAAHGSA